MRNHGSVILHSEKATPTRTEEFGLTLITILFSAPTWAEQYRTQNKPGISPTTENPARRRIRLRLPFQFPSNRFLPKSSSSRNKLNLLRKNQPSQKPCRMNQRHSLLIRFSHKWFLESSPNSPDKKLLPLPQPRKGMLRYPRGQSYRNLRQIKTPLRKTAFSIASSKRIDSIGKVAPS